ncbi:hypothetical protein ACHAQJ_005557 [Trichoderma viride]
MASRDLKGTPESFEDPDPRASSEMVSPDTRVSSGGPSSEGPAASPTPPSSSKSKGTKSVSFALPPKLAELRGLRRRSQVGSRILTVEELRHLLPATFRNGRAWIGIPEDRVEQFLEKDLNVDRLTEVDDYFFMLGKENTPPRTLHYQQALGLEIFVTERMDMHLLWSNGKIFIKPLPRYLLDSQFWEEFLECPEECHYHFTFDVLRKGGQMRNTKLAQDKPCKHNDLWMRAMGFAFSYVGLIAHESDFEIAKSKKLVPDGLDFEDWKCFVSRVLSDRTSGGRIFGQIDKRFTYGELDLARLNQIFVLRDLIRWLFPGNNDQGSFRDQRLFRDEAFFPDHFFLPPLSMYVAIVLVSMQVRTAYTNMKENKALTFAQLPLASLFLTLLGKETRNR